MSTVSGAGSGAGSDTGLVGRVSKAEELAALDEDALRSRLSEAKEELFNLRFQGATGQLDNNRRLTTVRRSIARIYTVMRERELGIRRAPDAASDNSGGQA